MEARLNAELSKQQELANQYSHVQDQLSKLTAEIAQSQQIEDPQQRNDKFEHLQKQIIPLLEEVQLLERQVEPSSTIEPQALKLQVNSIQKSANKAIEFAAIESQTDSNAIQIEDRVNQIEELLSSSSPTINELKLSRDMLVEVRPKLEEITRSYADLSNDDDVPIELRNKMADKLSKLNLLFEVSSLFILLI
jgi:hypothetical protein